MSSAHIFQESWEVDPKLSLFGVTKQELITVALKAIAAKNDATPIDATNAAGILSYLFGLRAIRMLLLPKGGWEVDRTSGIEATFSRALNIKIVFQNVDVACASQEPKAISRKGPGTKKLLENRSGYLWNYMEKEDEARENKNIWFLCVSSKDGEIRAELSLPCSIEDQQFGSFRERIFILTKNDWDPLDDDSLDFDGDEQDFDITVTKKQQ